MRIAPHPPERRAAVEALLRDTGLTMAEIAARAGVSPGTVSLWNAGTLARPTRRPSRSAPASWPAPRRAALVRLFRAAGADPGDVAAVAGLPRDAAEAFVRDCGGRVKGAAARRPAGGPSSALPGGLDAAALRASLRAHVARQIAAFDAALRGEGAAVLDSARVLRDLGGLKRLFDEIVAEDPAAERDDGGPDLPALRAEIARRLDRFVRARDAA